MGGGGGGGKAVLGCWTASQFAAFPTGSLDEVGVVGRFEAKWAHCVSLAPAIPRSNVAPRPDTHTPRRCVTGGRRLPRCLRGGAH